MKTGPETTAAAVIDAVVHYAETLLDLRFKNVRKNRYSATCPFHGDSLAGQMVFPIYDEDARMTKPFRPPTEGGGVRRLKR